MAGLNRSVAEALHKYADANRAALMLRDDLAIQVQGFHSVFRVASTGQLLIELVAQFLQSDKGMTAELGGIPLRGGTTVVASADGTIRYLIAKPLLPQSPELEARLSRQRRYLAISDAMDPESTYESDEAFAVRTRRRADFARLHAG